MVEEYVAWYDRHFDPAWQDALLAPANGSNARVPWGFVLPRTKEDVVGMGRSFARTLQRCVQFGLAQPHSHGMRVRQRLPPLSHRQLGRLPTALQEQHERWVSAAG